MRKLKDSNLDRRRKTNSKKTKEKLSPRAMRKEKRDSKKKSLKISRSQKTNEMDTKLKRKKKSKFLPFDYYILLCVLLLVFIGVVMVFSASFVQAGYKFSDPYFFLKRSVIYAIAGIIFMLIFSRVNYRILRNYSMFFLITTSILLILVFTPLGMNIYGSSRWIRFKGFTLMPSEIAKFVNIFLVAKILDMKKDEIRVGVQGVIPVLIVSLYFFVMIIKQPDLSTSASILMTTFVMLFVAGLQYRYLFMAVISGILGIAGLIIVAPYRMARFMTFLDPFKDPTGTGMQVVQSLYAFGTGGVFGSGLGRSVQKYFHLPEPQNDFIFAIIGEELGYVGCITIIFIYLFLIFRCIKVAINVKDSYASYLVLGIIAQIAIQTLINIGVATSSIPNTGIALPFISYGGSSLVIILSCMGIILNISRTVERN
ncbi:MAG: putative lipid II flippase FtsW [Peptostreptococcaceae bacterium]|jgi:cell division protein FtsW|nr:putative lipid II flippase FtsW [Peptostreptococcaceae bacterium]